jgi:stage II sporulation protein D
LNAAVIDSAVRQTKNLVMLDEKDNLYATYFHANCGGQTCQPDYVWNETLPGFDSFKDTFCIRTKQANWEKKIPVNEWKAFMVNKYDFPIWDSLSNYQLYNFQQSERHAFFIHPFYGIPLRDLREAFQLKSTFFSCSLDGEFVVLKGRGFGHGVGLCQEGAMNMSKKGFDYQQILLFYYPKMRLMIQSDRLNRKM